MEKELRDSSVKKKKIKIYCLLSCYNFLLYRKGKFVLEIILKAPPHLLSPD